jgi:hypothetical protein
MSQVVEVFVNTGEVIERDRTEAEETQFKADQEAAALSEAEAKAETKATATATAAAIKHAKSLGFTDQMISVMYPNLGA